MGQKSDCLKTNKSLLDAFMLQTLKDYKEPERKGTPKGQPIGFSLKKHDAALLSLKKIPLKQQSEMLNMSHGLLRKWRTEGPFRKKITELEAYFISNLIDHLGNRGELQKKLADDYFQNSVAYITKNPPPELTWNEFNDLKYYSPHLVATIFVTFPKIYESVIKRIEEITSDSSIVWSDEDRLLYAVWSQVETFLNMLNWYPYLKKNARKILEKSKNREHHIKELQNKAALIMIGHDWEKSGTVSEFTLKRAIYAIHNASGNFTPVEFDY